MFTDLLSEVGRYFLYSLMKFTYNYPRHSELFPLILISVYWLCAAILMFSPSWAILATLLGVAIWISCLVMWLLAAIKPEAVDWLIKERTVLDSTDILLFLTCTIGITFFKPVENENLASLIFLAFACFVSYFFVFSTRNKLKGKTFLEDKLPQALVDSFEDDNELNKD